MVSESQVYKLKTVASHGAGGRSVFARLRLLPVHRGERRRSRRAGGCGAVPKACVRDTLVACSLCHTFPYRGQMLNEAGIEWSPSRWDWDILVNSISPLPR